MHIFNALADPKRRSIVEMLGLKGQLTASQIYEKFKVTDSAISQHLKILKEAKVITVQKKAQQRVYQLNRKSIYELQDWITQLTQYWEERYEALDDVLTKEKAKLKKEKTKK